MAGCGGERATPTPTPTATATATATATPTATATATATPPEATAPSAPSPPPDAGTPSGEDQPGGAGDEAEARVPVALTVATDGTVSPPTVSVPAFLALELQVRNRTAGTIRVRMQGADPPGAFTVGAGKTGRRRLNGVRPGRYAIRVSGAGRATLVSGAEPGP